MAAAYQYSKLPPDSIRLLRLRPHFDPTAPIRCTLFDCPLLQPHDPVTFSPYEAISYVWGSTDDPQSITVRDCPISYDDDDEPPAPAPAGTVSFMRKLRETLGQLRDRIIDRVQPPTPARAVQPPTPTRAGTLSVTRNLHEALVQLRDRFIDRVLWIDAICINQADLDERSCQVASMARIYATASRVLVWLGPAGDDGAAEAFAQCADPVWGLQPLTGKAIIVKRSLRCASDWSASNSDEDESPAEVESLSLAESSSGSSPHEPPAEVESLSLAESSSGSSSRTGATPEEDDEDMDVYSWLLPIFRRPWFRRIWVLQEVAAARHIIVLCGSAAIDGLALCAILERLGHLDHSDTWAELQSGVDLMKNTFQRTPHGGVALSPPPETPASQQFSLAIAPLGQLLDMYLARQATDVRDKVYALLGMRSDYLCIGGLTPDYSRPLDKFFDVVCQHLFGVVPTSVKTSDNRYVIGMRGRGRVLGRIKRNLRHGQSGTYALDIKFTVGGLWSDSSTTWYVRVPTVRQGDIFFVLPGARWPLVGRLVDDSLLIIATTASSEEMEQLDWPGTSSCFWSTHSRQRRKEECFWSSDLWMLWDWSGTEAHHRPSKLFKDIFPSSYRLARLKDLSVVCWGAGYCKKAENVTKAILEEYREEMKHDKDPANSKEMLEDDQLTTPSDPDHGLIAQGLAKQELEREFEVLVSQLPECKEKQGLLGLWYLKCHLPPICDEEKKLLFRSAASENRTFMDFYPYPRYEEELQHEARKMREETLRQTLPPLRRHSSWPLFQKPPTDTVFEKDDLGEELMVAALTSTVTDHLQKPEDWLWFRLACHRLGQTIRLTPRVLHVLTDPSPWSDFGLRNAILKIILSAPNEIVGVEGFSITQGMFNNALVHRLYNRELSLSLKRLLEKEGESDKAMRMQARAETNIGVLQTLDRFHKALARERRRIPARWGAKSEIDRGLELLHRSRRPNSRC